MQYKQSGEFSKCEWKTDAYTETGADYTLPDYNGDVRKILYTEAKIRPSGSFENGENIDFSGIIVYNLIYSDSENRINSVSFTSDYDHSIKCGEGCEAVSFEPCLANFSLRLLGPRKISAKAALSSKILLSRKTEQKIEGTAFEAGSAPEVNNLSVSLMSAAASECSEREYAEELLRLDGEGADSVEVIHSGGECLIESVSADSEGAILRGTARIVALVKTSQGNIQRVEKTVKIDENIPFEGACEAMKLAGRAQVSSVRCSVNGDEGGCSVVGSLIAELTLEAFGNSNSSLVADAYSCEGECENEYTDFKYLELLNLVTERGELSMQTSREAVEIEGALEVICLGADVKISSCESEGELCRISGDINYSGIAIGADDKGNTCYHPFKVSLPFENNVNKGLQNDEKILLYPFVSCYNASAEADESSIYLKTMVQTKLFVCRENTRKILAGSELCASASLDNRDSKIVVYYPEAGESLFEIAKRFRTTVEKLTADNAISHTASSDGTEHLLEKKLLIY